MLKLTWWNVDLQPTLRLRWREEDAGMVWARRFWRLGSSFPGGKGGLRILPNPTAADAITTESLVSSNPGTVPRLKRSRQPRPSHDVIAVGEISFTKPSSKTRSPVDQMIKEYLEGVRISLKIYC